MHEFPAGNGIKTIDSMFIECPNRIKLSSIFWKYLLFLSENSDKDRVGCEVDTKNWVEV